jgi:uncharacterized oxidoreductase
MKLKDKRVLVTGGSSGIGLALARSLMAKGSNIFITGRRPAVLSAALDELRKGSSFSAGMAADIGTTEGRAATIGQAIQELGGLDIVVNNAGGVRGGRLEQTSEAEILSMVAVDLVAPILLTRAALPALRASGEAMVVNVSSGIALVGAPFYATYAAVKAGLAHFGESLRRELKGEGIHVLTAYLGGTADDENEPRRAGARFRARAGVRRRRRHRGRNRVRCLRGDPRRRDACQDDPTQSRESRCRR